MTTFQKIVKYLAIAFALFLTVNIIAGILMGVAGISGLLSDKDDTTPAAEMQTYPVEGEISSLSIELSTAGLILQTGEAFSVESNHPYVSVTADNGTLTVSETKKLFTSIKSTSVVITVPDGFVFDEVTVDTGAGRVEFEALTCDVLDLSLGAGRVDIHRLTANERAEIDGGAGQLTVDGGKLCNLNLDMGVGALTLTSRLEGQCSLDYGVGSTKLILLGHREDYQISLDKGLGDAHLAGEVMQDGAVYGTGAQKIDIDGGVGSITVDFADE